MLISAVTRRPRLRLRRCGAGTPDGDELATQSSLLSVCCYRNERVLRSDSVAQARLRSITEPCNDNTPTRRAVLRTDIQYISSSNRRCKAMVKTGRACHSGVPNLSLIGGPMIKRLFAVGTLLMAFLVPLTLHMGAANAVPCYASSCVGQNPDTTGCAYTSGATSLLGQDYTAENGASFRLNLRYSPECGAGWLQLIVYSGSNIGFAPSAWNPNAPSQGAAGYSGSNTWTAMVSAIGLQVCGGTQFYVNGNWTRWYYLGCYSR